MALKRSEAIGLALVMAVSMGFGQWLRSTQAPASDAQGAELRALVKPGQLQMISSTSCRYCTRAREWLVQQQVPFDECFIETSSSCRQRFQQTGAVATPTFLIGQQVVLGLDAARLLQLLKANP